MRNWEKIRQAKRRRAIKRQLRKLGVKIPEEILYDLKGLRELRRNYQLINDSSGGTERKDQK